MQMHVHMHADEAVVLQIIVFGGGEQGQGLLLA